MIMMMMLIMESKYDAIFNFIAYYNSLALSQATHRTHSLSHAHPISLEPACMHSSCSCDACARYIGSALYRV